MYYNRNDPLFWRKGNTCVNLIEKFNYQSCDFIDENIIQPLGMSPNDVTTISLPFDALSLFLFYNNSYWAAPVLYFALWLDYLDGYTARKHDKETSFGDKYDHTRDALMGIVLIFLLILKIYQNKNDYLINISLLFSLSFIGFWGMVKFAEFERHTDSENNETTKIIRKVFGPWYDKHNFFVNSTFYCQSTTFFILCIFVTILIYQNRKIKSQQ